jgi:hypothetical protein
MTGEAELVAEAGFPARERNELNPAHSLGHCPKVAKARTSFERKVLIYLMLSIFGTLLYGPISNTSFIVSSML